MLFKAGRARAARIAVIAALLAAVAPGDAARLL